MGLIGTVMSLLFGGGRNVVAETAGAFRENAEAGAGRAAMLREQALQQFAAEFAHRDKGVFDRFMDGLNRLPRPAMALGTVGLLVSAMVDPVWFAARMQGLVVVPEPLWWLLGIVVSFYFGARHQAKGQDFQRSLAASLARVPQVAENLERLRRLDDEGEGGSRERDGAETEARPDPNPALEDWRRGH